MTQTKPQAPTLRELLEKIHAEQDDVYATERQGFHPIRPDSHLMLLEVFRLEPDPELLKRTPDLKGRMMGRCLCRCGKEVTFPLALIQRRERRSCGCKDRYKDLHEKVAEEYEQRPRLRHNVVDLTGRTRGYLFIESYLGSEPLGLNTTQSMWKAVCVCGTAIKVSTKKFHRNKYPTCGSKSCKSLFDQGFTREEAHYRLQGLFGTNSYWAKENEKHRAKLQKQQQMRDINNLPLAIRARLKI